MAGYFYFPLSAWILPFHPSHLFWSHICVSFPLVYIAGLHLFWAVLFPIKCISYVWKVYSIRRAFIIFSYHATGLEIIGDFSLLVACLILWMFLFSFICCQDCLLPCPSYVCQFYKSFAWLLSAMPFYDNIVNLCCFHHKNISLSRNTSVRSIYKAVFILNIYHGGLSFFNRTIIKPQNSPHRHLTVRLSCIYW